MSDINYNLYKIFISVYQNKNLTNAAKELYIGQPNVSRSIKELEKHLGVKLFHSNPRGVEPTNEGIELYNRVFPALTWIDFGEKSIKGFNSKSTGVIRIACATNFAGYYLANHISEFNKEYPFIQFDIINKPTEEALEMLERNRVDLVMSNLPLNYNGEFDKIIIKEMQEIGFASQDFAKQYKLKNVITKIEFETLPYISIRVQEAIKKPIAIVDSTEMLFQLVIKGLGVGFCIEQVLDCNHPNDPVFKFNIQGETLPERTLSCIYNREYLNKATEIFLNKLKIFIAG